MRASFCLLVPASSVGRRAPWPRPAASVCGREACRCPASNLKHQEAEPPLPPATGGYWSLCGACTQRPFYPFSLHRTSDVTPNVNGCSYAHPPHTVVGPRAGAPRSPRLRMLYTARRTIESRTRHISIRGLLFADGALRDAGHENRI